MCGVQIEGVRFQDDVRSILYEWKITKYTHLLLWWYKSGQTYVHISLTNLLWQWVIFRSTTKHQFGTSQLLVTTNQTLEPEPQLSSAELTQLPCTNKLTLATNQPFQISFILLLFIVTPWTRYTDLFLLFADLIKWLIDGVAKHALIMRIATRD